MKKNIQETRKQSWLLLLALVIIAFAVSIGFSPLFELIDGGIAARILGSSFGAIFVIVLTMFLLNKQTEIEQESKKSERVFDEKVKIYQIILDICRDMLMDGKLTQEEINRLPFPLIKLQMLADENVISSFQEVFKKINEVYSIEGEVITIEDEDKNKIYELLSKFSNECRIDLEISDTRLIDQLLTATVSTISSSSKKANDRTKYSFNGKDLAKNKYVYTVITNYLNENPSTTMDEFSNILEKNFNGKTGSYEAWKTYDEVLNLKSGAFRFFVSSSRDDIHKDKKMVIKLADEEICLNRTWMLPDMKPLRVMLKDKGLRIE